VSGRPCLAYQVVIEVREGPYWRKALELCDVRPFTVADDSGHALVETTGPVVLALERDRRGSTAWTDGMDPASRQAVFSLLSSSGVSTTTLSEKERKVRYREGVLEEGETVSVAGVAARELNLQAQPTSPRALPVSLVLRGKGEASLLISDDPDVHGDAPP
jgi:hypothetical protein